MLRTAKKMSEWTHYLGKPESPSLLLFSFLRGALAYGQGFCNYTLLPYKTRMNSRYN